MTVDGHSIDGWPIHPSYHRAAPVHIEDRIKDTLQGRELAQAIRQSLKDRGIEISDQRYEVIADACEKSLEDWV